MINILLNILSPPPLVPLITGWGSKGLLCFHRVW